MRWAPGILKDAPVHEGENGAGNGDGIPDVQTRCTVATGSMDSKLGYSRAKANDMPLDEIDHTLLLVASIKLWGYDFGTILNEDARRYLGMQLPAQR